MRNHDEGMAELQKKKKQLAKQAKQLASCPGSCSLDISLVKRQKLAVKEKIDHLKAQAQKPVAAE
jgi:hypothetical protein